MTSAETHSSSTGGNAPDGVTEMFRRREERKAKSRGRAPRAVPPPMHPRPSASNDTGPKDDGSGTSENSTSPAQEPKQATGDDKVVSPPELPSAEHTSRSGERQRAPEPERIKAEKAPAPPKQAARRSMSRQAAPAATGGEGAAKAATDAALSWAAAVRKQAMRLDGLAAAVRAARADGTPALVLGAVLADAEQRAGIALPRELWTEWQDWAAHDG